MRSLEKSHNLQTIDLRVGGYRKIQASTNFGKIEIISGAIDGRAVERADLVGGEARWNRVRRGRTVWCRRQG